MKKRCCGRKAPNLRFFKFLGKKELDMILTAAKRLENILNKIFVLDFVLGF